MRRVFAAAPFSKQRAIHALVVGCISFVVGRTDAQGPPKLTRENLSGWCELLKAGDICRQSKEWRCRWARQSRMSALRHHCPDSYLVHATEDNAPLIVALGATLQISPAKHVCRMIAKSTGTRSWIVCPKGRKNHMPYRYFDFDSAEMSESLAIQALKSFEKRYKGRFNAKGTVIAGHNFGAVWATRIAAWHPKRFSSVVLYVDARKMPNGVWARPFARYPENRPKWRLWRPDDVKAFATRGGRQVLFVLAGCHKNRCKLASKLCQPFTEKRIRCLVAGYRNQIGKAIHKIVREALGP